MARKTFNEFCQIEVVELAKLAVEMQATNIELVNEFATLQAENERLKSALDIAIGYVKDDSKRTSIGQIFDIEQALKEK